MVHDFAGHGPMSPAATPTRWSPSTRWCSPGVKRRTTRAATVETRGRCSRRCSLHPQLRDPPEDIVNRGGDADTTGAIARHAAGACYGLR